MVDIIFKDIENIPVYQFDFPAMLFSLGIFIAVYELVMFIYTQKIKKLSLKTIMTD